MWYFLEFRRARTTLMRFTLLNDASRWTLSFQNFIWCQVPFEKLTACLDPSFPSFRRIDRLGWESWDTEPLIQTCKWDTREGANNCLVQEGLSYTASTFGGYLPVSLCLCFRGKRGRSPFLSLIASVSIRSIWNCMSLLSNTVHVPSTDSILPLSSQRWLFSLFDSWLLFLIPLFRSVLWSFASSLSDQYDVLLMSSILNNFCCWLFRTFSCSHKANTVWSWTESCNFDLHKPSRTISVGISLAARRALSHLVSKSWTSSFCKRILNRSDSPCIAS